MRLEVPLTGTVITEGSIFEDGSLKGDPNDPIRPVDLDLGNVSWKMVDVDIDNEIMIIEVTPAETVDELTGADDDDGNPIYITRPTTAQEKQGLLQHAQDLVKGHSKAELYAMSGKPKLKRRSI